MKKTINELTKSEKAKIKRYKMTEQLKETQAKEDRRAMLLDKYYYGDILELNPNEVKEMIDYQRGVGGHAFENSKKLDMLIFYLLDKIQKLQYEIYNLENRVNEFPSPYDPDL